MITYRKANESDMDFLLKLRESALREHVEAAGIEYDEAEQREQLLEGFKFAYIIFYNNRKAGLLKVDDESSLWNIIDLQLLPEFRGRGIGGLALLRIIKLAHEKTVDLTVNIYKSDRAIEFFKGKGFKVIGEDSQLYSLYYSYREVLEAGKKGGYFGELWKIFETPLLNIPALVIAVVLTFVLMLSDNPFSRLAKSINFGFIFNENDEAMGGWYLISLPIYFIVVNVICMLKVAFKTIDEE